MTGIPAKRAKGSRSEPRLDEQHVGARVIAIEHARHLGRLQVTRELIVSARDVIWTNGFVRILRTFL